MLNDYLKASIAILVIAVVITLPFAFHVKDSLKRGTLNTTLLQQMIWAAVFIGFCVAIVTSYEPVSRNVFTGSLYVLAYFVGVIGVLASPFIGWILASYLFGYLFWLIGGRKRILPTNGAAGAEDGREADRPNNAFGKCERPPE